MNVSYNQPFFKSRSDKRHHQDISRYGWIVRYIIFTLNPNLIQVDEYEQKHNLVDESVNPNRIQFLFSWFRIRIHLSKLYFYLPHKIRE